MVGKSSALRKVLKQIEVASTNSDVLVFGETGTGKELVARAIHQLSARRSNFRILHGEINCQAMRRDSLFLLFAHLLCDLCH
jgi:formate hydrogenlyase transcriptional activator